ncbi:MAG: thioredoxin domain-containing protein [Alphaproteobacteria bacterium]|nr:thioredoxin domain-containing protein [Alphaproteobacteria bacterium]
MKVAVCPKCSTGNRIAAGHDVGAAKCGKCGATIFSGKPLDVDDAQLQQHLRLTKGAVLLDVWAPWCGPCRMMAPHFEDAARQLEPDVRFLRRNADETTSGGALGVRGIPTLILFHNGKEIARQAGAMTAHALIAWTQQQLHAIPHMEKSA